MSVIPATRPVTDRPIRPRVVRRTTVEDAPAVRRRSGARSRSRSRSSFGASLAVTCAIFGSLLGVTYFVSSLAGNVLTERARQEGIAASQRAREARRAEAIVRREVDVLTSLGSTELWASTHGFLAPDILAKPSVQRGQLVATNP